MAQPARTAGQSRFTRILPDIGGQLSSPLLVGGRLAFLSDHEGVGNLYSCELDGGDLRRHTDHEDFYARSASTDGHRIVYQRAGQLWLLDDLEGEARAVDIVLASTGTARQPYLLDADEHLDDLSCDHTGRASAVEVQGTVHWLTHRDGPARALAATAGVRARLPRVLGRTGQVVWVADTGGQHALEVAPVSGVPPAAGADTAAGPRRLAAAAGPGGRSVRRSRRRRAWPSPAHDGRLQVIDMATGDTTELAVSDAGPVTGLAYSPDSAWLAWSHPGPRPLSRIRLARLADRTIVDVTDGRFRDTDPAFTSDGAYLAFLSRRSFDPVYDAHFFDLSFPFGCRPYLVPLAATAPSPFAPVPDGRPVDVSAGKDGEDSGEDSGEDGKPSESGEAGARQQPVTVDVAGLTERVVQLPVAEFRYSSLRGVQDGLVWLKEPLSGALGEGGADLDAASPRPALERFDLKRRTCEELVGELDWFDVSGDGTRLVVSDHDELERDPVAQQGRLRRLRRQARRRPVPGAGHGRARAALAPCLRRGRPDHAARLLGGGHGRRGLGCDPERVSSAPRHARRIRRLRRSSPGGSRRAWHLPCLCPAAPQHHDAQPVGLLGADLDRDTAGNWRVVRVLPGESSDPRARSPLATPGAAIRPGDQLIAVDGQPVDGRTGPASLLVGAAGKPVELTVGPAGGGPPRRVVVVPLADEERLRYQDWVADRRRHVRELSDGRVGYLHVPDMMGAGWAQFHRDLRVEMAADALVVDVRGNRGGHVSELVVEKLARRIIGWDVPRGLRPETYPADAPHGPVVAVADEHSGSDGDIVTAAFRILHLGVVVGTRTWGGVIGIDGAHQLMDGTAITVPRHAMWFDTYEWGIENHGVDPDVEVVMSPDDWARGTDPQLDTAVRLALESLAAGRPRTPPDTSGRPVRRRPPLPPRDAAAGGI